MDGDVVAREFYWWAVDEGWGLRRMLSEIGRPAAPGQPVTPSLVWMEIANAWRELTHFDD